MLVCFPDGLKAVRRIPVTPEAASLAFVSAAGNVSTRMSQGVFVEKTPLCCSPHTHTETSFQVKPDKTPGEDVSKVSHPTFEPF